MDDDFQFVELPDGPSILLQDKTAGRTFAYIELLGALRDVKEPELFAEGLEMLKRLRLSINIHQEPTLNVVKGGKPN